MHLNSLRVPLAPKSPLLFLYSVRIKYPVVSLESRVSSMNFNSQRVRGTGERDRGINLGRFSGSLIEFNKTVLCNSHMENLDVV